MLLKLSLGLAILLGLATIFFTHTNLGGKIQNLTTELGETKTRLDTVEKSERSLRTDKKNLTTSLEAATAALGEATNLLVQAQARAQEQQTRADRAANDLVAVTAARNTAEQELSQWRLFEMNPEQIRNNLTRLRQVERERDTYVADNQALIRNRADLQKRLDRYEGGVEREIELPVGAKGNVVAVDPKYDFVIVNFGRDKGLQENAKLLINRDGKLIGQVKVTSVEQNRAIANIMPEWKQDEIMEGDLVIPSKVQPL
jgi:DNA repair exonuclease SbcCD ATPase subunit